MLNLRQLEVFHAIYVYGSTTSAAAHLDLAQPTVSKALTNAERSFGFPLFRRAGGRLVPTEEAHELFTEIDALHERLLAIEKKANNLKAGNKTSLRVAVMPLFGFAAAPEATMRLVEDFPTARIEIRTLHHDAILESLTERDSDLVIGYHPPTHPNLVSRPIADSELVVFFRKDMLPAPPNEIALSSLQQMDFITVANSGPIGHQLASAGASLHLNMKEKISARTFFVAAALVRAGLGVAVIDKHTAQAHLTPELDYRPVQPAIPFKIHAMFMSDRPLSGLSEHFVQTLSEILSRPAPLDRAA